MNMSEDFIRLGMEVLIKRADGRTHTATITTINYNTRFVAVEWSENHETKGKEVDLDSLLDLNPHLVDGGKRNSKAEPFKEGRKRTCVSMPSRSKSAAEKNRGQVGDAPDEVRTKLPRTSSSPSLDEIPTSPGRRSETGARRNSKQRKANGPSPIRELKAETSPSKPSPKKKSSTVKEIEKLQKNRELRRLKQAEKKEEREALLTTHSGNPNWQFQAMIREYQSKMDFKPLTDSDEVTENHQITVCVRKRPLNRKEKLAKEVDVISVPRRNIVVVHEPRNKVDLTKYLENQQFRFDYIFDEMCNNETVYNFTAKPLVETVFEGGMATCFAYGQTGSGKTHTMSGSSKQGGEKGIYAMVAVDVFRYLKYPANEQKNLTVSASYYEIYGGKVFDLLAKNNRLRVLEDGKQQVQIVGLTEKVVRTYEEVLSLIVQGNNARTSGRTSANSCSSRSHAIFQITLRQCHSQSVYGRIHLIDLAGNERGADTSSASRVTRLEGAEINKSLLALKECIRALGRKGSHLPFRGSTLTLVLRDSFIGDKTKTCMIAMISPGMSSCEHTINTLRYADRVKELGSTELDQPEEKQKAAWVENKENESEEDPSVGLGHSKSPEKPEASSPVRQRSLLAGLGYSKSPEKPEGSSPVRQRSNKVQHLEQEMIEAFDKWTKLCPKFDTTEAQLLLTRAIHILRHAGRGKNSGEDKRPRWRSNLSESDSDEDVSLASRTANGPTSYAEANKTQNLELQMLGAFQLWTQLCSKFNQLDAKLFAQAHQLQYDPWKFTSELDRVLTERQKFLTGLRDRVTAFRLQISENNK